MQQNPFNKVPGNKGVINAMQRPNPTLAMTPGKAPPMSGGVKQALPPGAGQIDTGNGLPKTAAQVCFQQGFEIGMAKMIKAAIRGEMTEKFLAGLGQTAKGFAGGIAKTKGKAPAETAGLTGDLVRAMKGKLPLNRTGVGDVADRATTQGMRGEMAAALKGMRGAGRYHVPVRKGWEMIPGAKPPVDAAKGIATQQKAYQGAAGKTERVGKTAPEAQPNFNRPVRPGWEVEPVGKPMVDPGPAVKERVAQREAYQGAAGKTESVKPEVPPGEGFTRPNAVPMRVPQPPIRGPFNNARDQIITLAKQYPRLAAAMGGGSLIGAGGLGYNAMQDDKPKSFLDRLKSQF